MHDPLPREAGPAEPIPAPRGASPLAAREAAPGTGRRLQIAVGALAGALLLAYGATHFRHDRQMRVLARETAEAVALPPPVNTVKVAAAAGGGALTLPGETAAWYDSTIHARVNGYVARWSADIGDHVTKGQVLAAIETPELDASLVAAQAQLAAAQAQIKVWEARADFAKSTYARWRDSPKGVVSEQEREDKRQGYESAMAELASARAKARLDQAEVERLQAFQQFKQVVAPYAGTIIERHIDVGNLVTAGSTAGNTPLYRIAKDDTLRIFVDIPQAAAGDLMKEGAPARISVAGRDGPPIAAKITRTSGAIDPHARTFRAEVDIPNPDGKLVAGLYVRVAFQLDADGLLEVPAAALLFRAGGPQVAVVGDDGTVSFRPVTIARDDGKAVLLSGGIAAGERVALNISNQIAEGGKVRIAGGETLAANPAPEGL